MAIVNNFFIADAWRVALWGDETLQINLIKLLSAKQKAVVLIIIDIV